MQTVIVTDVEEYNGEEVSSNVNYKVDHHDNQIFDHPEAKFFVV